MATDKYDVFISYSRADYQDAEKKVIEGNIVSIIKKTLDDNSITYWIDEEGIYSGDNFAPVIGRAIKECSVFVFVSSRNSNSSQWVQNEVGVANHYRKPIIPIRLDESEYADNIVMYLTVLDFCEYYANPETALKKLVKAIREKLPHTKHDKQQSNNIDSKYKQEVISSINNIGDQMLDVSQIVVNKLLSNVDKISYEIRDDIKNTEATLHNILSCKEDTKRELSHYFNTNLREVHEEFESVESLMKIISERNIEAINDNTEALAELSTAIKNYAENLHDQLENTNRLLKQIYGLFENKEFQSTNVSSCINDIKGNTISKMTANIFIIIDVSGSMYGKSISIVNREMKNVIDNYKEVYSVPSNVNVELSVLGYSTDAKWQNEVPININSYRWTDLEASGLTNYGLALSKLNTALSFDKGYFSIDNKYMIPLLIFLTDGQPTDNWEVIYNEIIKNELFCKAVKYYVHIGEEEVLREYPNGSNIFRLEKVEDLCSSLNYIIVEYFKKIKPIKDYSK